uniref:WGS project CAEQ00000000 data, annotated contig 965 n=1 Tax=Trypanosoma congolense (strain IL3000) TaxID=1068625 RepID=F9WJX8_TRYCI|nr:unnamed protein product [Trypanosoma congolense IL3000]
MNLATGLLHTLPLTHATSEDNEQRLCGGRESDDAVAESVGKLPLVTAFVLPTWTVERVKQPAALDPVDVASSFAAASDKMCQERVSPPPAVAPASAPPSQKVWQEGTAAPATAGPMGPATGDGTNLYNPGAPGGVEMDPMREVVSPQGREMLQLSQQPPTPAPLLCKGSAPEAQTRMLALPSDTLFSKDAPLTSALSAFQQSSPFGGQDVRDTALPHAAAVSEEVQVLPPIEIPSPLQFPVIKPAAPLQ